MHQIATLFGIGHLRPAPGTWGSLAALPLALLILWAGGPWALVAATFAVIIAGYVATAAEITIAEPDPGHVVIDEVAGQWVALFPLRSERRKPEFRSPLSGPAGLRPSSCSVCSTSGNQVRRLG